MVRCAHTDSCSAFADSIADHFLSMFTEGDFLSMHDDGLSGDFAFILSLTKNWSSTHGGNPRLLDSAQ